MREQLFQLLLTIVSSLIASSGFWLYLQRKDKYKDASSEMLLGLGHDRIVSLGLKYIERGYITQDEYENLCGYLYSPYKAMNGNGSADRIMKEVDKLPIKRNLTIKEVEMRE